MFCLNFLTISEHTRLFCMNKQCIIFAELLLQCLGSRGEGQKLCAWHIFSWPHSMTDRQTDMRPNDGYEGMRDI